MYEYAKRIRNSVMNPGDDFLMIDVDSVIERNRIDPTEIAIRGQIKPGRKAYVCDDLVKQSSTFMRRMDDAVDKLTGTDVITNASRAVMGPHTVNNLNDILTIMYESDKGCAILYSLKPGNIMAFRNLCNYAKVGVFSPLRTFIEIESPYLDGNTMRMLMSFDHTAIDYLDMLWTDENETLTYAIIGSGTTSIVRTIVPFVFNHLVPAYADYLEHVTEPRQCATAAGIRKTVHRMVNCLQGYCRNIYNNPDIVNIQTADMIRILSSDRIGDVIKNLDSPENRIKRVKSLNKFYELIREYTNNRTTDVLNRDPKTMTTIDKLKYIRFISDQEDTYDAVKYCEMLVRKYPIYSIKSLFRRLLSCQLGINWKKDSPIYMDGTFSDIYRYRVLIREAALIHAKENIDHEYQRVYKQPRHPALEQKTLLNLLYE